MASVGTVFDGDNYVQVNYLVHNCMFLATQLLMAILSTAVDCGDLDDPAYGDVDFTTTTFRSKATYSCNEGFFLVGVKTRVCQSNGKWSGDAPVCKRNQGILIVTVCNSRLTKLSYAQVLTVETWKTLIMGVWTSAVQPFGPRPLTVVGGALSLSVSKLVSVRLMANGLEMLQSANVSS